MTKKRENKHKSGVMVQPGMRNNAHTNQGGYSEKRFRILRLPGIFAGFLSGPKVKKSFLQFPVYVKEGSGVVFILL